MKSKLWYGFFVVVFVGIIAVLCSCGSTPRLTSATYQSFAQDGVITYTLSQKGDNRPTVTVTYNGSSETLDVDSDAMVIAEEYCNGYTQWKPHAGDIDSRVGTLQLDFDDGTSYSFDVVGPLNSKQSREEADKVASYIERQVEKYITIFDTETMKTALSWQKMHPKSDMLI